MMKEMSKQKNKSNSLTDVLSETINRTIKKYNDLELDKDLSVIISVDTESKELQSNKSNQNESN